MKYSLSERNVFERMALCIKAECVIFFFSLIFLALFRFFAFDNVMMLAIVLGFIACSVLCVMILIMFAVAHVCELLNGHMNSKEMKRRDDTVTP